MDVDNYDIIRNFYAFFTTVLFNNVMFALNGVINGFHLWFTVT